MSDTTQFHLRLSNEILEQLKEEAKKQKRSVNNLIGIIIEEYLQEKQPLK